jgi:hypothetical protein
MGDGWVLEGAWKRRREIDDVYLFGLVLVMNSVLVSV